MDWIEALLTGVTVSAFVVIFRLARRSLRELERDFGPRVRRGYVRRR